MVASAGKKNTSACTKFLNQKIFFSTKALLFDAADFEKLQNFQRELITFDAKNEIALLRRFFLNSVKAK